MSLKLQETFDVTGSRRSAVASFKNDAVQLRRCRKATWNPPNYARTRVTCFWRRHLISIYSQTFPRADFSVCLLEHKLFNGLSLFIWAGPGPVRSKIAHVTMVIYWMCCSFADLWPGFTVRTVLASLDPVCSVWVTAAGVCPALFMQRSVRSGRSPRAKTQLFQFEATRECQVLKTCAKTCIRVQLESRLYYFASLLFIVT